MIAQTRRAGPSGYRSPTRAATRGSAVLGRELA